MRIFEQVKCSLILQFVISCFFRVEAATNLETIKQSYTNTINELTQELSVMKEELEKRNVQTDQSQSVDEVC
jgi:hypothetical protein